jgi:hypothetical protein
MNGRLLLLGCLTFLLFLGCKQRPAVSTEGDLRGMDKEKAIAGHLDSRLRFDILSLKGKADVINYALGNSIGFAYRIDIAKDSLILINLSKFGVPAATLLLAADTVKMKVQLNQTASICDYSLLQKIAGMDFDLPKFQGFLLGETDLAEPITMTSGKGSKIELQGQRAKGTTSWILNSRNYKLEKMRVTDAILGKESILTYSDFEKVEGQSVASTLLLEVTQPQKVRIELHHTGIAFDKEKVDFRFRIPSAYEIKSCDQMVPQQK